MGWIEKKRVSLAGSDMAYVDVGSGPCVVLLHGNPTSSFLWRHTITPLSKVARCIAPDLMGFGDSDKPADALRIVEHQRYIEKFFEALDLQDVTLVLHDWGSALGFDWARRHESRVRGLAFMEFVWPFPTWLDLSPASQNLFRLLQDPVDGRRFIIEQNGFVENVLPGGLAHPLSEEDMAEYRRPFSDPASREPIWRFPNELPVAGQPSDVYAMASAYHDWLLTTDLPKLFFWAESGALIPRDRAGWYARNLTNCRTISLGQGVHYLQEDHGERIGVEVAEWITQRRDAD